MSTKIKFFAQSATLLATGPSKGIQIEQLEGQINVFLERNPHIKVHDVRLTSHAAPVGDMGTAFVIYALLIYEADAQVRTSEDAEADGTELERMKQRIKSAGS